ncbi:hypothetical protein L1987_84599 [Smallanthus sonchifolius]|uniref:Uncharacterized protein n=1 Tax=Smallanthus sonchifolius TaxID=185202 RepID=A0ACB8XUV0_9ASTR|nr:hypothetical protein L1987_84599 [Smallanthus sonchifolius]
MAIQKDFSSSFQFYENQQLFNIENEIDFQGQFQQVLNGGVPRYFGYATEQNEQRIVEVEDGRIIRSTGLKDRHSKGTRDRRVRLSPYTAIQFYDVQDRLGYDHPSKAVDWLINKAKASIDQLPAVNLDYRNLKLDDDNHMGNAQNSTFLPAPTPAELLSRTSSQKQNLKLSLQSDEGRKLAAFR